MIKIADFQKGTRDSRSLFTRSTLRGGPIEPKEIVDAYLNSNRALFGVQRNMKLDMEAGEVLGLDEEATSALYLYQNDTITDKQLLDEKKYGDAGKMAHDLRVGVMRERVFFGYAMADGKDGTPVMKKLKLTKNYTYFS